MKIGDLKHHLTLVKRVIQESEDGEFRETFQNVGHVFGRLKLIKSRCSGEFNEWGQTGGQNGFNRYALVMQKLDNRNALHADLYGLRFKQKLLKLVSPLDTISNDLFVEAVVMEVEKTKESPS